MRCGLSTVIYLGGTLAVLCGSFAKNVPRLNKRSHVCYDGLGCFANEGPFFEIHRLLSFLPESPDFIDPKFKLYTRRAGNGATEHLLDASDNTTLTSSTFLPDKLTKFIVHGFIDNGGGSWLSDIKDELLKHGDYNVVIVDWGRGSMNLYEQATANTRVVGAMIAQLINFLQSNTGARPEDMHIIGHSLGAHAAGYAGERLHYLGRITGLDPAEPYFEHMDPAVRLDPTDALFVDVIHSDSDHFYSADIGFGMDQTCGHVDFFPNGGHDQPGCSAIHVMNWLTEGILQGTEEYVACSHSRAINLFNESINSVCPFEAYRCDSEDDFKAGNCVPCSGEGCSYMGMRADLVKPSSATEVKYYLNTGASWPYCRYHYRVTVNFAADSTGQTSEERGYLYVHLTGRYGQTEEVKVTESPVYFKSGQNYTYLITSPTDIGYIRDVSVRWHHQFEVLDIGSWNFFGFRHPHLTIDYVHVASGETHTAFDFCNHHSTSIEADQTQLFAWRC